LLVSSPFETNMLAAGAYVFGIKAVDYSNNESVNDIQIEATLNDPRMGSVVYAEYPSGAWPGAMTNCYRSNDGTLQAADTKDWASFATDVVTWDNWHTWARDPYTPITYDHPTIDLGVAITFTPYITAVGQGTVTVQVSYSTDGSTYTGYAAPPTVSFSARYLKIRVTVAEIGGVPAALTSMSILLSAKAITEDKNDLNTATLAAAYRVAAGHIYLPLGSTFAAVSQVLIALQGVPYGWSYSVISKTHVVSGKICPEIKIYNQAGVLSDAIIDAMARGV